MKAPLFVLLAASCAWGQPVDISGRDIIHRHEFVYGAGGTETELAWDETTGVDVGTFQHRTVCAKLDSIWTHLRRLERKVARLDLVATLWMKERERADDPFAGASEASDKALSRWSKATWDEWRKTTRVLTAQDMDSIERAAQAEDARKGYK